MASANLVDPNTGDLIPYSGNVTPYVRDSVAPLFSTSIGFNKGSYCYHDGKLYECTTAHLAGAWNPSHFTEVTVGDQLATLKSGLIKVVSGTETFTDVSPSTSENLTVNPQGIVVAHAVTCLDANGVMTNTACGVTNITTNSIKIYARNNGSTAATIKVMWVAFGS